MTDLVTRLLNVSAWHFSELTLEAADEIERLQKELAECKRERDEYNTARLALIERLDTMWDEKHKVEQERDEFEKSLRQAMYIEDEDTDTNTLEEVKINVRWHNWYAGEYRKMKQELTTLRQKIAEAKPVAWFMYGNPEVDAPDFLTFDKPLSNKTIPLFDLKGIKS